jgi:hypothetical protein
MHESLRNSFSEDWMSIKRDLATVFHRLAVAYEDGDQFNDAIRIYLRELSLRESTQVREAADVIHCLQCLAAAYDNLGDHNEAEHQRLRAILASRQMDLGHSSEQRVCDHKQHAKHHQVQMQGKQWS